MAFQCKMASVSIYREKEGSQRINKVTTNLQGHHSEAGVYINIYLTNMLSQQTLYSDIGAYVNIQFNKMLTLADVACTSVRVLFNGMINVYF